MERVSSYLEFVTRMSEAEKSFLLLYREGSDQSSCAYRNIEKAAAEMGKIRIFLADVNNVRDIHGLYGVESFPSLLVFSDGRLTNIVRVVRQQLLHGYDGQQPVSCGQTQEKKSTKRVTVYSTPSFMVQHS